MIFKSAVAFFFLFFFTELQLETVSKAFHITYGAMSRFALQKCSKLAQMLLANLLIARVIRWHGKFSRNLIWNTKQNFY